MAAVERHGARFPTSLVVLGVVVLAGFLFVGWVKDLIPGFGNPFGTETVDRSGPTVLKSIENLRDFRAASGHFEVIVDVEKDARFVPSKIKGERVLFVAVGSVDAGVDFRGLEDGAVDVSDDGEGRHARAAARHLPRARARSRALPRLRPRPRRDRPAPVAVRRRRRPSSVSSTRWRRRSWRTPLATAPACWPARSRTPG